MRSNFELELDIGVSLTKDWPFSYKAVSARKVKFPKLHLATSIKPYTESTASRSSIFSTLNNKYFKIHIKTVVVFCITYVESVRQPNNTNISIQCQEDLMIYFNRSCTYIFRF